MASGGFVCRATCTTDAECRVGDTSRACARLEGVAGGEVLACTLPCELFSPTASGCPTGEACDALELSGVSGNVLAIDCRPLDVAMLGQEQSCSDGSGGWDITVCAAGFDCDGTGPDFVCQALCTRTGVLGPPCPSGFTCQNLGDGSVRFRGSVVGSCDPS